MFEFLYRMLYIYIMDVLSARKRRGIELKFFRIEKGLTQKELAKISGLTQATISHIETGSVCWSIDSELIYFETLKNHNNAITK